MFAHLIHLIHFLWPSVYRDSKNQIVSKALSVVLNFEILPLNFQAKLFVWLVLIFQFYRKITNYHAYH